MKTKQQVAEELVLAIVTDLSDRQGFDHCWDGIDADVRDEIRAKWTAIIAPYVVGEGD